ncbi:MAG: hypothetical protein R3264_17990, partial [Anaerolineae bacterium]|nr:hypothetical protein [Anaerolineae bacterium]
MLQASRPLTKLFMVIILARMGLILVQVTVAANETTATDPTAVAGSAQARFSTLTDLPVVSSTSITSLTHLIYLPFIVGNAAPGTPPPAPEVLPPPELLSPPEASVESEPVFDWSDVSKATSYVFQLSDQADFSNMIVHQTVTNSHYPLTMPVNGLHYWRVMAQNSTLQSDFSAVRSIQLSASLLTTPTLLGPADGSPQARPSFDWTDVSEATAYHIQVADNSDFIAPYIDQALTNSEFSFTSVISGAHYWRVYATDGENSSPWSVIRAIELVEYAADTDGDNLPNGWELHGYDHGSDGTIDVDLPNLGADYLHKDVYVEMDYMVKNSLTYPLAPNQAVIDRIEKVFVNAPVPNPDGVDGINLHLELADEVPFVDSIPWDNGNIGQFYELKAENFEPHREPVYHYMIWGHRYANHNSQKPFAIGISTKVPGPDFLVTLGSFDGGTDDEKVGAFVHEFGHNLGLAHGGNNTKNYKPNYLSSMNYWWAIDGVSYNGEQVFGYQPFNLPSLNESSL